MSFFSQVRTRHIHGWVSIIWFTSVISVAADDVVRLRAASAVTARCGDNVTLTCDTSSRRSDIILFKWLGGNKTCRYGARRADPGTLCRSEAEADLAGLTMTLLHVTPSAQGKYLCKLHAAQGETSAATTVTVQSCVERSPSAIDGSRADCCVKPRWLFVMAGVMMVTFMT